jgi:hypothetical protein
VSCIAAVLQRGRGLTARAENARAAERTASEVMRRDDVQERVGSGRTARVTATT